MLVERSHRRGTGHGKEASDNRERCGGSENAEKFHKKSLDYGLEIDEPLGAKVSLAVEHECLRGVEPRIPVDFLNRREGSYVVGVERMKA